MEEDGQRQGRDGVGRFRVGWVGGHAGAAGCGGFVSASVFLSWGCVGRLVGGEGKRRGLHSAKVDCSGTEPVRRTVRTPMVMKVKPRVRQK